MISSPKPHRARAGTTWLKKMSPIKLGVLALLLRDYPNVEDSVQGFRIPYERERIHIIANNFRSVKGMESKARHKTQKEVRLDLILKMPLPNLCIFPVA